MFKNSWVVKLVVVGVLVNVGAQGTQATTIVYNADVVPDDPSLQDVFATQVLSGCSWSVANGELTMNTVYGQYHGLWFGKLDSWHHVNWEFADPSGSNSLSVRTRLAPSSGEWSFYLDDGAYSAGWELFEDGVRYGDPNGEFAGVFSTSMSDLYSIDTQAYHTYSFCLSNGQASYSIDGVPTYSGPALPTMGTQVLAIGDTSGNSISGYGSMILDQVTIETVPIPEPSTLALFGIGVFGLLTCVRRRKRAM